MFTDQNISGRRAVRLTKVDMSNMKIPYGDAMDIVDAICDVVSFVKQQMSQPIS